MLCGQKSSGTIGPGADVCVYTSFGTGLEEPLKTAMSSDGRVAPKLFWLKSCEVARMLEPQSAAVLALARWLGQVLALRIGTRSELTCVCPSCPAYTFSCTCNGGSSPAIPPEADHSWALVVFVLGLVVGLAVGGGMVLVVTRVCKGGASTADKRELLQLELRRLRKGQ